MSRKDLSRRKSNLLSCFVRHETLRNKKSLMLLWDRLLGMLFCTRLVQGHGLVFVSVRRAASYYESAHVARERREIDELGRSHRFEERYRKVGQMRRGVRFCLHQTNNEQRQNQQQSQKVSLEFRRLELDVLCANSSVVLSAFALVFFYATLVLPF
ncbi:hypothetical protein TKK_0011043 [Trichogramma kaykai]